MGLHGQASERMSVQLQCIEVRSYRTGGLTSQQPLPWLGTVRNSIRHNSKQSEHGLESEASWDRDRGTTVLQPSLGWVVAAVAKPMPSRQRHSQRTAERVRPRPESTRTLLEALYI